MVACKYREWTRSWAGNVFGRRRKNRGFSPAVMRKVLDQAICLPIGHVNCPQTVSERFLCDVHEATGRLNAWESSSPFASVSMPQVR
jgi:hypothetical protein